MWGFFGSDFDGTMNVSIVPTLGKATVAPSLPNLAALSAVRAKESLGIQSTPASSMAFKIGFDTSDTAAVMVD